MSVSPLAARGYAKLALPSRGRHQIRWLSRPLPSIMAVFRARVSGEKDERVLLKDMGAGGLMPLPKGDIKLPVWEGTIFIGLAMAML